MRAPAKKRRIQNRAVATSLPAPVLGWNAIDSLGAMDPLDAVLLTNLVPFTTYVGLRYGYSQHVTGIGSQVQSLMAFSGLTSNKLLAAAGTAMYNVTTAGAVGAAVQSGLTNAKWQYINYANTSGNYLYMVNGADAPRYWDGTNFTNANITGVTVANLIHINEFKNRIWFVEKEKLKAWYLGTASINGAATAFDLSGIALRGGYLMAMATWTIDAGYGVDDLAVFITSNGEVIVYRGTDPVSSTTWQMVGRWWIGSPVGRRCFTTYAGDLLIICQDGVYPLSAALQSSRLNPKVAVSYKIQSAVSQSVSDYGANFGWQIIPFPKLNQLYLNVPIAEGASQQQYVMNTINKAWCNFTGWNANCWELYNDHLYFGGNGVVCKAWDTLADNSLAITGDMLQAFNHFKSPAIQKRFTMMRPVIQTNGSPSTQANINVDFDTSAPTAALAFTPSTFGTWDVGVWDTAIWGGSTLNVQKAWQGTTGVGNYGAPRVKVTSSGIIVQLVSTDVVYEPGGII